MSTASNSKYPTPWRNDDVLNSAESLGERISACYEVIGNSHLSPDMLRSILSVRRVEPPQIDLAPQITARRNLIGSNIRLFIPADGSAVENEISFVEIMLRARMNAGAHPFDINAEYTTSRLDSELRRLNKFRKFGMKLLEDWEEYAGERFALIDFSRMRPLKMPHIPKDEDFRINFTHDHDGHPLEVAYANWLLGVAQPHLAVNADLVIDTPDISRTHEIAIWEFLNSNVDRTPFRSMYARAFDAEQEFMIVCGELRQIAVGDENVLAMLEGNKEPLWRIVEACMDSCRVEDVIDLILRHPRINDYSQRMEIIKAAYGWAENKKMDTHPDGTVDYKQVARQWLVALDLVGA
jgi:hypothetical protein